MTSLSTHILDRARRCGVTTAMVYGSSHIASVDALFAEALARDMRLNAGKPLMDRFVPDSVIDTVDSSHSDTLDLIERWGGKGRLGYAVTPRFAVSSSDAQLTIAGEVLRNHPEVWMQTHLAENTAEVALAGSLFPHAGDYLNICERFGLVGPRSVFAHFVHLQRDGFSRRTAAGASVAFCLTSNLFLGSGLFDLETALGEGVKVGIGTDVGAGTTYSVLRTLGAAYKVGQLRGTVLEPMRAFYLATLGGARALDLGDRIGNFEPGKEADFLVLDLAATPLLTRRMAVAASIEERLFARTILGDDRVVERTYLVGVQQHRRGA
jgi:guanine deaminase